MLESLSCYLPGFMAGKICRPETKNPADRDVMVGEELKTSRSAGGVYLKLLKKHRHPLSPDEMPRNFFIPSTLTGCIEPLILKTISEGREYGQRIAWDQGTNTFLFGKETKGDYSSLLFPGYERGMNPFQVLIKIHTHPNQGYPFFSLVDVLETFESNPSYISMVASENAVYALTETEQFSHRKRSKNKDALAHELDKQGYRPANVKKAVKILASRGLAVYRWHPARGDFENGDLRHGMELEKMH